MALYMKKKWILGEDEERDNKLKVGDIIWFKGKSIMAHDLHRIAVGKIKHIDIELHMRFDLTLIILCQISTDRLDTFSTNDWTIHNGDEIEKLSKKEAFFYAI
jgi:hypothetical protein